MMSFAESKARMDVLRILGEQYFDIRETITHMQEVKKEFHGYDNSEYYELLEELIKKAQEAYDTFTDAMNKDILGPGSEEYN
tara:strand:- start:374 stop:619 length:246 start_codon:yes stop_codon:yes gene_type:complete